MATRREFLLRSSQLAALAALAGGSHLAFAKNHSVVYSARRNSKGQFLCCAYQLDGTEIFSTPVPFRLHDVVVHPYGNEVLYIARRPGTKSFWLDRQNGKILAVLEARKDRHFYGHGVFDATGRYLYLTQNNLTKPGDGVISVYRYQRGALIFDREFSSHGIEPHQLLLMPAGDTLAIANGGIRTAAGSRATIVPGRVESSLVLLGLDGQLKSKETLAEPQNSLRHLAVSSNGTLVCVQQYKGDGMESISLIATKLPAGPLQTFPVDEMQQLNMNHYCASVAVPSARNLMAVTAPRGNRLLVWDLVRGQNLLNQHLPDCAGVAASKDGFVVSTGQGACVDLRYLPNGGFEQQALPLPASGWDNHWVLA